MAEKNNAVCSICGKGYHVCLSCRDAIKLAPYKKLCCSADCYKTFQVVKGYSTGVYNKEEFKSKLKNIDLSNLENYKESVKNLIKDTLKEDEVVEPIVEPVEETDSIIVKEVEVDKDEIPVMPVTASYRKKKYKVEAE